MIEASLFGKPLPDGGTIGVAATASPYESRSDVLRSVEWWEAGGYRVKLGEHVFAQDDFVAGPPSDRAADLMAMFADPEVDVVQCLQGGYGSAQVIPHLDFDVDRREPEAVRRASPTSPRSTWPSGSARGWRPSTATASSAWAPRRRPTSPRSACSPSSRAAGPARSRRIPTTRSCARSGAGRATAPLVGGCLSLLMQTLGTPWEIDLEGAILFFEDYHLPPYYLDGILTQLAHAGKLDGVRRSRSR